VDLATLATPPPTFASFATPWYLLLLLVVVALAVGYVMLLRRRRRDTVAFTSLELLERIAPRRPGRIRHLPAAALILALTLLTIALAGPTAEARVPRNKATVVLVIDVSLSMQATDVAPTRLAAAQAAAKSFADQLTPGVNLGLVSFAGTAAVLVSPTTDRASIKRAVDGLRLSESTATGEAIFAAMSSVETFSQSVSGTQDGPTPARIVLMSDGKQTVPGPDGETEPRGAFTAARKAAEAKIPVSTISFGTDYGSIEIDGDRTSVAVDDASMREIAELSGGQFFTAATEDELRQVYAELGEQIGYEMRRVDSSRPWLMGAALLLTAGLGAGIALGRRLP
jgi:Ca-activated chloride channel family protein